MKKKEWEETLKQIQERGQKAWDLIDSITLGEKDYHGSPKPIIALKGVEKLLKDAKATEEYKTPANHCFFSVKSNKDYYDHSLNTDYIRFKDFHGHVSNNEIIQAMSIIGCTEFNTLPSIELIQWSDCFLLLVKSPDGIGSFKCFVGKEAIFQIFQIEEGV